MRFNLHTDGALRLRLVTTCVMIGVLSAIGSPALGAEAVEGYMFTAGVTGRPGTPHAWMEENIFLGALDKGFGSAARTDHTPPGWFSIPGTVKKGGFPAGPYALFTLSYSGQPAFSFDMNVRVPASKDKVDNLKLETPAHYSVMYNTDWKEWGESPWISSDDFYQTFIATSPHVTRIATKLSDKSGDHYYLTLNYAVYETNDGPPSTWKRISPVRSRFLSEGTDPIIHVFHVPYQSQEVKLEVGRRYAVRFWRDPSSQSETFHIVARKDKGDGYAHGHLYSGDTPHEDLDAYAYVSGGAKHTVVNHAPVKDFDLKDLIGGGKRFGQTFKATGKSLAAVDIIYATGDPSPPRLPITFQLYDQPDGRRIGPSKTSYGMPLAFQGRAAAIWRPGEVPLEAGQMYYLEWSGPGCNTWKTEEDLPGHAFVDGEAKPKDDLALSIAEYTTDRELKTAPTAPQE